MVRKGTISQRSPRAGDGNYNSTLSGKKPLPAVQEDDDLDRNLEEGGAKETEGAIEQEA